MFGGYCPAPYRLTSDAKTGLSSAAHARLTADVASALRSVPFARLNADTSTSGTVYSYSSQAAVGVGSAPTVTWVSSGTVDIEFSAAYQDYLGKSRPINIHDCKICINNVVARIGTYDITAPNKVQVKTFTSSGTETNDQRFTLYVYADWLPMPRIGDYGGDLDKEDCATERVPYAFVWYNELTAMLPDAFTTAATGQIHAKKMALARSKAGIERAIEKSRWSSIPATSDETLGAWVRAMDILVRPDEQRWRVRRRVASKMRLWAGNSRQQIDDAITELAGDKLHSIVRYNDTDLNSPPDPTYWPGVNPGPASYDLGGGAWSSRRAHLTVLLKTNIGFGSQEIDDLIVDLHELLDMALPAKSTFNIGTPGPFLAGISRVGIDSL